MADDAAPDAMYLGADEPHRSVRPHRPADAPAQVIVEGESHVPGEETATGRRYEALEAWASEALPVRAITASWSAQDYVPVDDLPMVGPITSSDNRVLVATGFGKWGMSNGSAAALAMADHVLEQPNAWSGVLDSARSVLRNAPGALLSANVAVARDYVSARMESGTRVCTHMGCGMRFNEAERSWDCPCHGSRFTEAGEVIEGPATRPLDPT